MDGVVVDTDVVSCYFKNDTRAALYDGHLVGKVAMVSFQTVAELDRWALQHRWGKPRRAKMERHLRKFVVAYADRDLCRLWAEACDGCRRQGRAIQTGDAWVAATALLHDVPLVTHNRADYANVSGLTVVSEAP